MNFEQMVKKVTKKRIEEESKECNYMTRLSSKKQSMKKQRSHANNGVNIGSFSPKKSKQKNTRLSLNEKKTNTMKAQQQNSNKKKGSSSKKKESSSKIQPSSVA